MHNDKDTAHELPEDLLYGINPVREALRRGRPMTRVWVSRMENDRSSQEIIGHCRKANIPFKTVDKAFIDRLCLGRQHQGVVAQTAPRQYTPWREMLVYAKETGRPPLIVLLDGVEDPHNLGAVLRSVDALGAHGVVIPKNRSASLTSGVAKASAGAWEYVLIDRVTNLTRTIEEMKAEGLWVMGATTGNGQPIYDVDWKGATALVLGGEHKGLSTLVQSKCDVLVSIPMEGKSNSLNVSVATAVILSEIGRQRKLTMPIAEQG